MKTPYPFQVEDIKKVQTRNHFIGSECGIGKTLEAIEAVKARRTTTKGPILVLCLKRSKAQWVEEIREADPGARIIELGTSGRWPSKLDYTLHNLFHPRHHAWIVSHHEALSLPKSHYSKAWKRWKYKAPKEWRKFVWEAIIVDESHRFKDRRSSRFMWLKTIDSIYKLALTGTPMEKSPADMWSTLHWLYPSLFTSYWQFFEEFVEYEHPWIGGTRRRDIRIPKGVKETQAKALAKLLAPFYIQRTKEEVRPDIPPNIKHSIPVTLDRKEKQWKLYAEIARAKDIEVDLSKIIEPGDVPSLLVPNVLAKIVRLQQVLADPKILGVNAPSAKLEWVTNYVKDNPNEPLVVFTKFRHTAQVLANKLDAHLSIGGSKLPLQPPSGVHRLVGTIAYIGASVNLQWASTAIFVPP